MADLHIADWPAAGANGFEPVGVVIGADGQAEVFFAQGLLEDFRRRRFYAAARDENGAVVTLEGFPASIAISAQEAHAARIGVGKLLEFGNFVPALLVIAGSAFHGYRARFIHAQSPLGNVEV